MLVARLAPAGCRPCSACRQREAGGHAPRVAGGWPGARKMVRRLRGVAGVMVLCAAGLQLPAQTLAQTPAPTPAPTPTSKPTGAPTPTSKPTGAPTAPTTDAPSGAPTPKPTVAPTTLKPTGAPTTAAPTAPSKAPTGKPTAQPTFTQFPTLPPPTPKPTPRPTVPTAVPTAFPTWQPTFPTPAPSSFPTLTPFPTAPAPTPFPTLTSFPTSGAPSAFPTTVAPVPTTGTPSAASGSPSRAPSAAPTGAPTALNKTGAPSAAPSSTSQPSRPADYLVDGGGYCGDTLVKFPPADAFVVSSFILGALGLIAGLAGLAFVGAYRDRPVLMLSQRSFLALFCVGIVLINVAVLVKAAGTSAPSAGSCVASSYLLYTGLTLSIACLCVKEWRVYRVYSASVKYKGVKFTAKALAAQVLGIILGVQVLLVIWLAAFPPTPKACEAFRCSSGSTGGAVASYAVFVCVLLLTLAAVVLAYWSRAVPSVGGESSAILITAGFALFSLIIVGLLLVSATTTRAVETWLLSFAVCWCSLAAMGLVVFKKWRWIDMSVAEVQGLFLRSHVTLGGNSGAAPLVGGSGSGSGTGPASSSHQATRLSDISGDHHVVLGGGGAPQTDNAEALVFGRSQAPRPFNPQRDIIVTDLDSGRKLFSDGRRETPADVPLPPPLRAAQQPDAGVPPLPPKPQAAATTTPQPQPQQYVPAGLYSLPVPAGPPPAAAIDTGSEAATASSAGATAATAVLPAAAGVGVAAAAAAAAAASQEEIEARRLRGFKIGEETDASGNVYEEYVDRETGESFWLSEKLGRVVAHWPPSSGAGAVTFA